MTKCSRSTCLRNLLLTHCNKLNKGTHIETLILNGFSLTIWPRFVKLTWYMVVKQSTLSLHLIKVNYALNHHWYETSLLPQAVLNYMWYPEISLSKSLCNWGSSSVSLQNKEICMALFHIRIFSVFTLQFALLCTTLVCGSQVYTCMGHNLCMSQWHLDLLSVSSKSTSVTDFQLWIWHSFWYENLWGYQDNFIHKIACCYIVRIIKIIVLWIILVH